MTHARSSIFRTALVALLAVLALTGCASERNDRTMDAAGMTREQVAALSLHQEYDHYRDRYNHMQHLLEDAQRVVHDGEWAWNGGDDLPFSGGDGGVGGALRGSDDENSYYLVTDRLWSPPGATGAKRDLDPMIQYFQSKNWQHRIDKVGSRYYLMGITGDGWQLEYMIQPSGTYALTVYSELFWTNNYEDLSIAIDNRSPDEFTHSSRPGEYPPFPRWDAPVTDRSRI